MHFTHGFPHGLFPKPCATWLGLRLRTCHTRMVALHTTVPDLWSNSIKHVAQLQVTSQAAEGALAGGLVLWSCDGYSFCGSALHGPGQHSR